MMIMIVIMMVIMMMMKVTGGPIIYARAGSAVTLECAVSGLAAAPAVLRWTRSGEDDLSASVSPRSHGHLACLALPAARAADGHGELHVRG